MEKYIENVFPFWKSIEKEDKKIILDKIYTIKREKNTILFNNKENCNGIQIIKKGRVRLFITSPNGNEITLYRLIDNDLCILSASCLIKNLTFETEMQFEKDTEIIVIPKEIYEDLSEKYPTVKTYTLELLSEKFSDVMWLFNQFVFSNMASRLAKTLIDHRALENNDELKITHEILAKDLGTAREVVTRLLKQFQTDNLVKLSRGKITILNYKKLYNM